MFLLILATVLWGTDVEQSSSGYVARDLSRTNSALLSAHIMSTEKLVNGLIDTVTKRGISVICRNEESGVTSISNYKIQRPFNVVLEIAYLTDSPLTPETRQQILWGLLCICCAQIHLAELWSEFVRRKVGMHTIWNECEHESQNCGGGVGGICQRNHAARAQEYENQIKAYQSRIDELLISLKALGIALENLKGSDAK